MSGTALVYAAELNPTKPEIAREHGGLTEIAGSYRLVDHRGDAVGIEALIGPGADGRLAQLPLSYRSDEVSASHTYVELDHSVLGRRFVSNALGDPVAVHEIIRTIVTGDDGAAYSDGTEPYLAVRGTGTGGQIGEVELDQVGAEQCSGTVEMDGATRRFELRIPRRLTERPGETAAGRLHLVAPDPAETDELLLVAELDLVEG